MHETSYGMQATEYYAYTLKMLKTTHFGNPVLGQKRVESNAELS